MSFGCIVLIILEVKAPQGACRKGGYVDGLLLAERKLVDN